MFGLLTSAAEFTVESHGRLAGLAGRLPAPADFFDEPPWFEILGETCLPPGARLRTDVVPDGGGPALAVPGMRCGLALEALANFYTCRLGPPRRADSIGAVAARGRSLRLGSDRPTRLLFRSLDDPEPLRSGLAEAGWLTETWPHFGNWYLPVAGLGFDAYWAQRDGRLRNTVERKERALARAHAVAFRRLHDPEAAVAAYEHVHARSWKEPEPHPAFMPALIRRGLALGALRVGALMIDGEPAAAQVWVVWRRRATIFKLAYAEDFRRWSPGSILTRHLLRELLDEGAADELDFGCGDDAFKCQWLPHRRQRWGLAAYDPTTVSGLWAAGRNLLPRMLRRPRPSPSSEAPLPDPDRHAPAA